MQTLRRPERWASCSEIDRQSLIISFSGMAIGAGPRHLTRSAHAVHICNRWFWLTGVEYVEYLST